LIATVVPGDSAPAKLAGLGELPVTDIVKSAADLLPPLSLITCSRSASAARRRLDGYRSLQPGQKVEATIKGPLDFEQDGYRYIATAVWLLD
jgi:hypothetical protein